MKGVERDTKDEALKTQISIRCAKAAILLSSLKSFPNETLKSTNDDEDEERQMLMRAVTELKIELARQRMRNRRIRLCSLMEVVLLMTVLLSVWSFCFAARFVIPLI